jgi:hypothetical protein
MTGLSIVVTLFSTGLIYVLLLVTVAFSVVFLILAPFSGTFA